MGVGGGGQIMILDVGRYRRLVRCSVISEPGVNVCPLGEEEGVVIVLM